MIFALRREFIVICMDLEIITVALLQNPYYFFTKAAKTPFPIIGKAFLEV